MTPFIVGEVSKNWEGVHADRPPHASECLCGLFEQMIEHNRKEGYRLHSWQLHRVMTGPETMNETIIAVFEKPVVEPPPPILLNPVNDLKLSVRVSEVMRKLKITTIGDLCQTHVDDLLVAQNFGEKSLIEVREKLARHNLKLPGD